MKENILQKFTTLRDCGGLKKMKTDRKICQKTRQKEKKKKLHSLLNHGEKVFVLAERLKKKMHLEIYINAQQKTDHTLTRTEYLLEIKEF